VLIEPGGQLPTREQLGDEYKASPGPVDEALAVLRAEYRLEVCEAWWGQLSKLYKTGGAS
jgi:Bacterial regulatory proteins, gntR family